jgi:hypothetical protein
VKRSMLAVCESVVALRVQTHAQRQSFDTTRGNLEGTNHEITAVTFCKAGFK